MIEFKAFPSKECNMSTAEQEYIKYLFNDLSNINGYTANLQYIYNNTSHSPNARNLHFCDEKTIRNLYNLFKSNNPKNMITVLGTIHPMYHTSDVVVKLEPDVDLLVRDNYIRMKLSSGEPNTIYHFFVSPPEVKDPNYGIFLPKSICRMPNIPIEPILNESLNEEERYSCIGNQYRFNIILFSQIKLMYENNRENLQFNRFYSW